MKNNKRHLIVKSTQHKPTNITFAYAFLYRLTVCIVVLWIIILATRFSPTNTLAYIDNKPFPPRLIFVDVNRGRSFSPVPELDVTGDLSWSADGKSLAFSTFWDNNLGILHMPTHTIKWIGQGWFPAWSPDKTRMIYYDADFSELKVHNFIQDKLELTLPVKRCRDRLAASWLPDHPAFVFVNCPVDGERNFQNLYLYDIEDATLKRLTRHNGADGHPAVSPDGKFIAYKTSHVGANGDLSAPRVIVRSLYGEGDMYQLPGMAWEPSWSSDGTQIAYRRYENNRESIWIYTLATGNVHQIPTTTRNSPRGLAWMPR